MASQLTADTHDENSVASQETGSPEVSPLEVVEDEEESPLSPPVFVFALVPSVGDPEVSCPVAPVVVGPVSSALSPSVPAGSTAGRQANKQQTTEKNTIF